MILLKKLIKTMRTHLDALQKIIKVAYKNILNIKRDENF